MTRTRVVNHASCELITNSSVGICGSRVSDAFSPRSITHTLQLQSPPARSTAVPDAKQTRNVSEVTVPLLPASVASSTALDNG